MTAKQSLEKNRMHVKRYVERMAAKGWKKYCFLVPHALAAEMYELKREWLSELKDSNQDFTHRSDGDEIRCADEGHTSTKSV